VRVGGIDGQRFRRSTLASDLLRVLNLKTTVPVTSWVGRRSAKIVVRTPFVSPCECAIGRVGSSPPKGTVFGIRIWNAQLNSVILADILICFIEELLIGMQLVFQKRATELSLY